MTSDLHSAREACLDAAYRMHGSPWETASEHPDSIDAALDALIAVSQREAKREMPCYRKARPYPGDALMGAPSCDCLTCTARAEKRGSRESSS